MIGLRRYVSGVLQGSGVLALTAALAACQVNPATGGRDFTPFMSTGQEAKLGREAHPGVVAENGGVYKDDKIGGYVAQVGGQLAVHTETPNAEFTFTVLNSPLVNAFALPGGFVYVTRGILAMFNDEAELASVLGHEIGHVTARHTAKRYTQQMMTGILGAGVGLVTGSGALSNIINQGGQLYLLSYSRDQEYQSDDLGIRYMSRSGYDPYGSPDMLRSLLANDQLSTLVSQSQGKEKQAEFQSTHPNTAKRVAEAEEIAARTGLQRGQNPRYRDRYLDAIDGMLYGDDPAQGLVRDQNFYHPGLKFTYRAPPRYVIQNGTEAVLMKGPNGNIVLFTASPASAAVSTTDSMQQTWSSLSKTAQLQNIETTSINGMEAVSGQTIASTQSGQVTARIVTIRYDVTNAYSFVMLTPAKLTDSTAAELKGMIQSFRKLSVAEAAKIKPLILRVVRVKAGDTVESLARRMAFSDYQIERFRSLNGLQAGDVLKANQRVKLIIERP